MFTQLPFSIGELSSESITSEHPNRLYSIQVSFEIIAGSTKKHAVTAGIDVSVDELRVEVERFILQFPIT